MSDFKAKPPQFVSIDFLNANLSESKAINRLARGIIRFYKSMLLFKDGLVLNEVLIAHILRSRIQKGIDELKELQEKFRFYIDHLTNNSIIAERDFVDFKKYLDEEDEKLAKEFHRIGTTELSGWPNLRIPGTLGAIKPILCYDLMRRVPYPELVRCKNCNKFLISKKKIYCSEKCKDSYNNRRKTKTGQNAQYVREWRRRKKEKNFIQYLNVTRV